MASMGGTVKTQSPRYVCATASSSAGAPAYLNRQWKGGTVKMGGTVKARSPRIVAWQWRSGTAARIPILS